MSTGSILTLFRDRSPVYRDCFRKFVKAARDYGYDAVALAPEGTTFSSGEVDHHYFCPNYDDASDLRKRVRQIHGDHNVQRIMVSFEGDVYPACLCREENGISGMQPEVGIYFRDKNAMSARARELGIKIAESCLPHTFITIERFVEQVGFPIVLKPYDGMACMKTYKIRTREELSRAWDRIKNERHDYRVEKFVEARQFHLDSLTQRGEVVFGILSEYTYRLLDSLSDNYSNTQAVASITRQSDLSAAHKRMFEINSQIMTGFGFERGVTHAEFYLTRDGEVYFGEVGARVGGAYIVPMLEKACGLNIADEWARIEIDHNYMPSPPFSMEVGAALIVSPKRGRIVSMTEAEAIMSLESVVDAQMWMLPGKIIKDPSNTAEAIGFYVCQGNSFEDVLNKIVMVGERFHVETVPAT